MIKSIANIAAGAVTVPILFAVFIMLVAISVGIIAWEMACHVFNTHIKPMFNN